MDLEEGVGRRRTVALWKERPFSVQLLAVVRHTNRADACDALVNGEQWVLTEDFTKRPLDPPLSDSGIEEAQRVGQKIRDFAEASDGAFDVVVTSSYYRCIQTAVEICKRQSGRCRLIVDHDLGEVFGPEVLGHKKPRRHLRPCMEWMSYCSQHGVRCQTGQLGKRPTWPEHLAAARRRYTKHFLTCIQRSTISRQNFVIVSHDQCVRAALSIMPSHFNRCISSVPDGGCFLAKRMPSNREVLVREPPPQESNSAPDQLARVPSSTTSNSRSDDAHQVDQLQAMQHNGFSNLRESACNTDDDFKPIHRKRTSDSNDSLSEWVQADSQTTTQDSLPEILLDKTKVGKGWQVEVHNVDSSDKVVADSDFSRKVKSLAKHTPYSTSRIKLLLGELPNMSLGEKCRAPQEPDIENIAATDAESTCSTATFLFGTSDVDMSRQTFQPSPSSPTSPWSPRSPESPSSATHSSLLSPPSSPILQIIANSGTVTPVSPYTPCYTPGTAPCSRPGFSPSIPLSLDAEGSKLRSRRSARSGLQIDCKRTSMRKFLPQDSHNVMDHKKEDSNQIMSEQVGRRPGDGQEAITKESMSDLEMGKRNNEQ